MPRVSDQLILNRSLIGQASDKRGQQETKSLEQLVTETGAKKIKVWDDALIRTGKYIV